MGVECALFLVRGSIGNLDIGEFFLADSLEGVGIWKLKQDQPEVLSLGGVEPAWRLLSGQVLVAWCGSEI